MTKKPNPIRPVRPCEEGYMLVAVIFMLALLTISLSVALPRIAKQIQRDREVETMHRGKQFIRAIKLYYKKFNAYPPTVDALVKTNEIRFLRKKYIDPTTGKEAWKPVLFGQNKAPTAMGFFGQAITGSTMAGIGPSGGNGASGGLFPQGQAPDPSAPQAPPDPNSPFPAGGGPGTTGSTIGSTGQTFGGAGIIGFSPNSSKESILVYKKKTHYNEWEFVYDPMSEMTSMAGNTGNIGQPIGGTPIGNPPFGGGPIGGSPTPTPTPPAPTPPI